MKKILSLLVISILCFSLISCGKQPTPTDTVNSYLEALKSSNTEQMSELYSGDISDVSFDNLTDAETYGNEFYETLETKLLSFEYTLSNEKINGDEATVDATIKTYDIGNVFRESISEYFSQALSLVFSGASDEEIDSMIEETFLNNLNEATFDYESTVTIKLTKTDKGWIIDNFQEDTEIVNALTGGMLDAIEEMADSFE